jgi:hypothetical protein
MLLVLGATACAGAERSAADCVNQTSARLGASEGSVLRAICSVPETIVLIAMPPASRADSHSDRVPKEIGLLIRQSREEGYNWCAFPRDELSALIATGRTSGKLRYECRRVLADLPDYSLAAGRIFQIELRRTASGSVDIIGIKGDAEFGGRK